MTDFFEEDVISAYGPGDAVQDGMLAVGSQALHDLVAKAEPVFALGTIVYTPGALDAAERSGVDIDDALGGVLRRYAHCDWGDMEPEDVRENQISLMHGHRLMGSYAIGGEVVWAITEADRALTTVLTPSEY